MTSKRLLSIALVSAFLVGKGVFAEPEGREEVALAIPAVTAPAPRSVGPEAAGSPGVRSMIEASNESWLEAFRRGDTASMGRIYTPDARMFPPSSSGLEGPERIVAWFEAQRRAGLHEAELVTLDVVEVGDVAYEVGAYGFRPAGGEVAGDTGRYFAIWKRQDDGSWRCQVGTWTSNRDATSKD